jgi:transglutaminase-like putative cysteine protease
VIYHITHNTTYLYGTAAEACHNLVRLDPRTTGGQRPLEMELHVEPAPIRVHTYVDYFGNRVRSFAVLEPHQRLSITSESRVAVDRPAASLLATSRDWRDVQRILRRERDDATIDALQYVFDSVHVRAGAALAQYASVSFSKGHLQIGCLKSLGLAARYVSGYLRTDSQPGQPRLEGADASHAWISVYCTQNGWIDFDPTNGCLVGDRHITLGWGRDFHDVSPIKGVVLGGGGSTLRVGVEVKAIDANESAA